MVKDRKKKIAKHHNDQFWGYSRVLMRTIILFFILIILLLVLLTPFHINAQGSTPYIDVGYMQGLDTGGHGLPVSKAYPAYYDGEIHIFEAYTRSYDLEVKGIPIEHYHIIPVHLVPSDKIKELCARPGQILPSDIVACFVNWKIYIINGQQGAKPSDMIGGCNILWHELKHADGLFDDGIVQLYPNKECSVGR